MNELQSAAVSQSGSAGWEAASAPAVTEGALRSNPNKEETKSLTEMMQEAKEKAEKRRDSFKLKKNGSQYGDAAMTAYSKLARARNQAEVNAAAGYARRRIAQFQGALSSDSDNSERIKAAIRQLQKAVGRARKKGRDLDREKVLQVRQKKAQQEQERRKAAQLNQELNRKKTLRMIRESGYLRETEIDNRLQAQLAQTRLELRAQAEKLAEHAAPSVEAAAQQYAAASSPVEAAPAASVDVQV